MELLVKPMQLYDSNYNLYASGLGIGDSVDPNLTMCKYLGKCEDIQCKFRHPRVGFDRCFRCEIILGMQVRR